jgi:hypothetical protein
MNQAADRPVGVRSFARKRRASPLYFEQAKRFRLKAKMQGVTGALAQSGDMIDAAPKIICDRIDLTLL